MTIRVVKIADDIVASWLPDLETPFVGLMTADPYSVGDPLTVEVPGYSRAPATWTVSGRFLVPEADLLFAGVPGGTTAVAIAGFDGPYSSTMKWALLHTAFTTGATGQLLYPASQVKVGFAAL